MYNDPSLADLGHIAEAFQTTAQDWADADSDHAARAVEAIEDNDVTQALARMSKDGILPAERQIAGANATANVLSRLGDSILIQSWMRTAGFQSGHAPLLELAGAPKLAEFCRTLG